MAEPTETEIVKFYTSTRRFPRMIGRLFDGTRLPGGPYSITEFVAVAGALAVASYTATWWARHDLITNGAILLGFLFVVWFIARQISMGERNPVPLIHGMWVAVSEPRYGRINGRTLSPAHPRKVVHLLAMSDAPLPTTCAASVPDVQAQDQIALTGRQSALAEAVQRRGRSS